MNEDTLKAIEAALLQYTVQESGKGASTEAVHDAAAEHEPTQLKDTGPDWGFIDKDGNFVAVPKRPIKLANVEPPIDIMTWEGMRRIIVRPQEMSTPEPEAKE